MLLMERTKMMDEIYVRYNIKVVHLNQLVAKYKINEDADVKAILDDHKNKEQLNKQKT